MRGDHVDKWPRGLVTSQGAYCSAEHAHANIPDMDAFSVRRYRELSVCTTVGLSVLSKRGRTKLRTATVSRMLSRRAPPLVNPMTTSTNTTNYGAVHCDIGDTIADVADSYHSYHSGFVWVLLFEARGVLNMLASRLQLACAHAWHLMGNSPQKCRDRNLQLCMGCSGGWVLQNTLGR